MTENNKTKDLLDKKYELKRFFKTIFDGIDFSKECIGILILNEEKSINIQMKFRDFDLLVDAIIDSKYRSYCNMYYYTCSFKALSETYTDNDICRRYSIGLDFDKKDYSNLDMGKAIKLFKRSGLSYHYVIDSGNGYHIYSCIEPTADFEKLKAINKELKEKTGCDARALHINQILRIPLSFNTKQYNKTNNIRDRKQVNIVVDCNRYDKSFKRYKVEDIYEWLVVNKLPQNGLILTGDRGIPWCVQQALENGTQEGNRHHMMVNMIGYYKSTGKSKDEVMDILEHWATLSDFNKELDAKFDYYWNHNKEDKENKFYGFYFDCKGCKDEKICNFIHKSKQVGIWEFDEGYYINNYDYSLWNRRIKDMNGNELLVMTILYNYRDVYSNGMTRAQLIKELTYRKKCRISKPTLTTVIDGLEEKGIIEVKRLSTGHIYKINSKFYNDKKDNIKISYMATTMCITGAITTDELKLYYVLRFIHEKEDRNGKSTYGGSYFCMTQSNIAKIYKLYGGGTNKQSNISNMINGLTECKMMKLIDTKESKNNGYNYNIYKLNC